MPGKTGKKETLNRGLFRKYFFLGPVFFLYLIDQISKQLIVRILPEDQTLPVIQGFFYLTRVNNTGAAFGLFRGAGAYLVAATLASILVLLFCLVRYNHQMRTLQRWGWILVAGGALGNLHDRIYYQYVIDFFDFRVWPVFNLADSFVCVGVFLVALSAFKGR